MKNDPRPNALAELVRRTLAAEDLSYADVAKKGALPKPTVAKLATRPLVQSPKPETLLRLAAGLGLPVAVLQEAVAEALGYSRQEVDEPTRNVVAMLNEMSEADRTMAAAMVATIYRRNRGEEGDQQ